MSDKELPLKKIVIVGGGAAGWLTAGRIAAEHNSHTLSGVQVVLVESKQVKTIGVGEGTWPTMRTTLQKIGVNEAEFIAACDVSFKQASKFVQWQSDDKHDAYYHPFQAPLAMNYKELVPTWQSMGFMKKPFAYTVSFQPTICDKGKAPKLASSAEYTGVANYGYHLDAAKLGEFLKAHCINKLGVKHIVDHVTQVNSAPDGYIKSLSSNNHGDIPGDLFIDCSGLSALLIGQHYEIPFIDKQGVLFNDSALAVHLPYLSADAPISSHTTSTAQSAGWIWDIGLPTRRGVGYTYSSLHICDEQAEKELREYIAKTASKELAETVTPRKISFKPGHRETFWHKNCVAVGMASGFLEPLEATALVLIETAARNITEQLPVNRQAMKHVAKRYNKIMNYHWQGIIDFLKLHYVLSKRDEPYWRDNRDIKSIPESLQELLKYWQYHPPSSHDFQSVDEFFSFASYQYILYGMGFETTPSHRTSANDGAEQVKKSFRESAEVAEKLIRGLPNNREFIEHLQTRLKESH